MNSAKFLLSRLLNLYPTKLIKEIFEIDGKWEQIEKYLLGHKTEEELIDFALSFIDYTHQHIYIFNINKKFKTDDFSTAGFPLPVISASNMDDECIISCLPKVKFDVIVTKPNEEMPIEFYQPIKISVKNNHLILQATTIKQNLSHYFGRGRKVVDSVVDKNEQYFIKQIGTFFGEQYYDMTICDLHKGIKKLWADDIVDSKFLKAKKSKSTNTVAMDENFTVRKEYPDEYQSMIDKPILKTLFRYIGTEEGFICDQFTIDPLKGELSVQAYSENNDQIKNLINEIIKYN